MRFGKYIELSDLQEMIRSRIGYLEQWVRVEIESHKISGGHHYLNLLEKSADGAIMAKANAMIWRSNEEIVRTFTKVTGITLNPGITIVVKAVVNYHPQYGLSLNITDIDPAYSIGQRELEKRATIEKLTKEGMMELQKSLELPYLPSRVAVISSETAAGYGDFVNQLARNDKGFKFEHTLFHSLVQGDNAAEEIISNLKMIEMSGNFDVVLILRGGGADSDMFCFDEYELGKAIAECQLPVLTAIGHEKDYHVADMVANRYFKTPTALAVFLIDWVTAVEDNMVEALMNIQKALRDRISDLEKEATRCVTNIQFVVNAKISKLDNEIALLEARIKASDPRNILRQGYVLAVDKDGTVLKNVRSKQVGDDFALRFSEGRWDCHINGIRIEKDND